MPILNDVPEIPLAPLVDLQRQVADLTKAVESLYKAVEALSTAIQSKHDE